MQRAVDPAADRGGVDEAQHGRQRPGGAALDGEHRLGGHVGDAAVHAAQGQAGHRAAHVAQRHRAAVEDDLAGGLRGRRPARRVAARRRRRVVERHVLQRAGEAELAARRRAGLRRPEQRELGQVAVDAEGGAAHGAAAQGALDVAARAVRKGQRQVAREARHAAVAQAAFEPEPPREAPAAAAARAGAGLPGAGEGDARVGVGERGVLHRDGEQGRRARAPLDAPLHLRLHAVERQQRLGEHAGQLDGAVLHRQPRLAAALGGGQRHVGVAQPGAAERLRLGGRPGVDRQAGRRRLHAVAPRRVDRPLPLGLQAADDAARPRLFEQPAQLVAERQPGGDLRQRGEVEPGRRDAAAGERRAGRRAVARPGGAHVAGGPVQAVGGEEVEAVQGERAAAGVLAADEAAARPRQRQRLAVARRLQQHVVQRHVGGGALDAAVAHVDPGAQRALAAGGAQRQLDVAAQLGRVGARQQGVAGAAPAPPVARPRQQRLPEDAAQREALAERRRRRGVEAQLVAAQPVAHDDVDRLQRQRLRRAGALLVGPAQGGAAHGELALAQQPVERGAVVAAGAGAAQLDAGDEEAARGVAPHVERGAVDDELVEARFEPRDRRQQRARAEHGVHARQDQRRPAGGVVQRHVAQLGGGHPAAGAHDDLADRERHAERRARMPLQLRTPAIDVGQNDPVQGQPCQQHDGEDRRQPARHDAHRPAQEAAQRTRDGSDGTVRGTSRGVWHGACRTRAAAAGDTSPSCPRRRLRAAAHRPSTSPGPADEPRSPRPPGRDAAAAGPRRPQPFRAARAPALCRPAAAPGARAAVGRHHHRARRRAARRRPRPRRGAARGAPPGAGAPRRRGHRARRRDGGHHARHDRAGRGDARPRAGRRPRRARRAPRRAADRWRRADRLLGRRHGQARRARAQRLLRHRPRLRLRGGRRDRRAAPAERARVLRAPRQGPLRARSARPPTTARCSASTSCCARTAARGRSR